MSDFWKNIIRYPRFFFSSLVGSLLVILTPFRNLFKTLKFRIVLGFGILAFAFSLYSVIANMANLGDIS